MTTQKNNDQILQSQISFGTCRMPNGTKAWVWIASSSKTAAHIISKPCVTYAEMMKDFLRNGLLVVEPESSPVQ